MHVTMVKKRLSNGEDCRKCLEAESLLKDRGLWSRIDRVVWAIEGEPDSEGMQLGARHSVANAPFFIVRDADGQERVFESTLKFIRALAPVAAVPTLAKSSDSAAANDGSDPLTPAELDALGDRYADADPQEIVRLVLSRFGAECALAFSGAEDVVLIDMAARSGEAFSVFCLDTGRLHPETYRFIDKVRQHYDIEIELLSPQAPSLQAFVRKKGLFSFYEDGHGECCGIRKVEPLRRTLAGYRAWMTGQRRDQSPDTRASVPVLQADRANAAPGSLLWKSNPLANWSSQRVWRYIREHALPYNELHERGFVSIGCEPCTRAILPGQHEREGRWWWEEATKKECGLHSIPPPAENRSDAK
jgi:phosphoadenosine phosphosulfate reductase